MARRKKPPSIKRAATDLETAKRLAEAMEKFIANSSDALDMENDCAPVLLAALKCYIFNFETNETKRDGGG